MATITLLLLAIDDFEAPVEVAGVYGLGLGWYWRLDAAGRISQEVWNQ